MSLSTLDLISDPIPIGDDEVLLTEDYALVSSATKPGHWYTVSNQTCDCQGYAWRRTCRHLKAAEEARRQYEERRRQTCSECHQVRPGVALWGRCAMCILNAAALS